MEAKEIVEAIHTRLTEKLGNRFPFQVYVHNGSFGGKYVCLWMACSTHEINNVRGQRPQIVSLVLDLEDMKLEPHGIGGNGGQCIYRQPNMEDPKERYLAMKSVKVPFRKPKNTVDAVVECVGKFADSYIRTLDENYDMLRYKEVVDYATLLGRTK